MGFTLKTPLGTQKKTPGSCAKRATRDMAFRSSGAAPDWLEPQAATGLEGTIPSPMGPRICFLVGYFRVIVGSFYRGGRFKGGRIRIL